MTRFVDGARATVWYRASVGDVPARPALEDDARADVAIVGGGFTGVATALELAERGVDVVLLEADRIGDGATGRNGGQVTGSLSGLGAMRRQLGRTIDAGAADDFVRRLRWDGQALIRERVARYGIECELVAGHLHAAWSPRHRDALRHDVDDARATGVEDVAWLGRDAVHALLETPLYHGGALNRHNLHLNSLKLCLGEARAAEGLGARLFEGSEVLRVEPGPSPALVTARGRVRASRVLLAGNAYHRLYRRRFRGLLLPAVLGNLVTEPLGNDVLDAIDPERLAVYDSRTVLDYYRPTGDGRLMFGGGTNYSGRDLPDVARALRPALEATFPRLRGIGIEYAWTGRAGIVPNRVPLVGELPGGIVYAQGYSGHGIATSHLVARAVAARLTGGDGRDFGTWRSFRHRRLAGGSAALAGLMALAVGSDRARSLSDKLLSAG